MKLPEPIKSITVNWPARPYLRAIHHFRSHFEGGFLHEQTVYFGGKFKMTKSTYQNPVLSALEFVNHSKTGQEPLDIAGFQV